VVADIPFENSDQGFMGPGSSRFRRIAPVALGRDDTREVGAQRCGAIALLLFPIHNVKQQCSAVPAVAVRPVDPALHFFPSPQRRRG
jgi:hypothetical protein